jgi:hypothetical protein
MFCFRKCKPGRSHALNRDADVALSAHEQYEAHKNVRQHVNSLGVHIECDTQRRCRGSQRLKLSTPRSAVGHCCTRREHRAVGSRDLHADPLNPTRVAVTRQRHWSRRLNKSRRERAVDQRACMNERAQRTMQLQASCKRVERIDVN